MSHTAEIEFDELYPHTYQIGDRTYREDMHCAGRVTVSGYPREWEIQRLELSAHNAADYSDTVFNIITPDDDRYALIETALRDQYEAIIYGALQEAADDARDDALCHRAELEIDRRRELAA